MPFAASSFRLDCFDSLLLCLLLTVPPSFEHRLLLLLARQRKHALHVEHVELQLHVELGLLQEHVELQLHVELGLLQEHVELGLLHVEVGLLQEHV